MMEFCPEHPKWDQNPKIKTPKRDEEHPHPFQMRSSPPPPTRGLILMNNKYQ